MSEFRSLQGLRNSLRHEIERGVLRSEPIQKVCTTNLLIYSFYFIYQTEITDRLLQLIEF